MDQKALNKQSEAKECETLQVLLIRIVFIAITTSFFVVT
ncbi:hypothetical protein RV16_GL001814 [Enterococcus saccharolyticus]|nr:hypothetical protein RV16_GL001814 [Enterococcus saccharolyticus]